MNTRIGVPFLPKSKKFFMVKMEGELDPLKKAHWQLCTIYKQMHVYVVHKGMFLLFLPALKTTEGKTRMAM